MIRPLIDGAERTVLNGDSVDTRFIDQHSAAAAGRDRFLEFIAPFGERLTLVTGNHDPDISPHHHLELAEGRILVTHGDVLFPSVAPWGWEAAHVLAARTKRLAELPLAEHELLETQLGVCKHASYATRHLSPSALHEADGPMVRFMRLASRVRRADKILTSWFRTPNLAANLAAKHRPRAELVIIGHTHFPGIWRRQNRTVINTGAFTPPFGATAVDFVGDHVDVRAVVRTRDGFGVGRIVRTLRPDRDFTQAFF